MDFVKKQQLLRKKNEQEEKMKEKIKEIIKKNKIDK